MYVSEVDEGGVKYAYSGVMCGGMHCEDGCLYARGVLSGLGIFGVRCQFGADMDGRSNYWN